MKNWGKRLGMGFAVLLCCLMAAGAMAETARVITPGGKLNVRKAANEKAKLVTSVPNRALVEVEEVGEEWSRITYKHETGYVKTSFLRLASQLIGKTVYADEGALLLRSEPQEDALALAPIGCQEPVTVLSLEGDWARVQYGDMEGYVPASAFTYQLSEPSGSAAWMNERAMAVENCKAYVRADAASAEAASIAAGQEVTVTLIEGKFCFVLTDGGNGWAPVASLALAGAEDSGEQTGSISPAAAIAKAEAALKKQFKAFAKEKLYSTVAVEEGTNGFSGTFYHCGFYNDQDQYLYGAWINAQTGSAVFAAHYEGFAVPRNAESMLPEGEVAIEASTDALNVGEVVDFAIHAWTRQQSSFVLYQDGKQLVKTEAGKHFTASFRPRESGEYRLEVTVQDQNGLSATAEYSFAVGSAVSQTLHEIYSQKDGWWKDKAYRKSDLDQSGCAIFTLSHALYRMGHEADESIDPEKLAKKYALCLTPEGTNNERLITTAAKDYGFSTKRQLIKEQAQIVDLLKKGNYFSFSIARGHIAMVSGVSEDGTMIRVVDSAPRATFERIVNDSMYYQLRSGTFRAVVSLDDIPGSRWYLDQDDYGGMEYWLTASYVAKRGVRLIQPGE